MIYEPKRPDVAVFIDFENVYVSVRDKLDANPNFETIMDRCNDLGRVVVARAYADWYRYPRVTSALYANGIEPMYVPTYYYDKEMGRTGRAIKNSVDMNLCIDAMKTLYTTTNIEKFVLATGDRDFIPLVNSIRQQGKEVIIIGIGGAASAHLAQSADEFIFYEQLVGKAPTRVTNGRQRARPGEALRGMDEEGILDETVKPANAGPSSEPDVYDVLVEAVHLVRQRGYVSTLGSLKLVMKELMGGDFKESRYRDLNGRPFAKFKDFVLDAERRNKVIIFTSGTVNEVFLPGEDPLKLSQFAADLKEEPVDPGYDLAPLNNGAGPGLVETVSPEVPEPVEAPPTTTTSRRRRRRSRSQRKAASETPALPEQPVLDTVAETASPPLPPGDQPEAAQEQPDAPASMPGTERFEYPVALSAIFDQQPSDQALLDMLSDMGFHSMSRPEDKSGSEADRDLEARAKYLFEELLLAAETASESGEAPAVEVPVNLDFWQIDDAQADTTHADTRDILPPEADPDRSVAEVAAWVNELQRTPLPDDGDMTVSPVDGGGLVEEGDFRADVVPDNAESHNQTPILVEAHMQTALQFDADRRPATEDSAAVVASISDAGMELDAAAQKIDSIGMPDSGSDGGIDHSSLPATEDTAAASMPEAMSMDATEQPALKDVAVDDRSAVVAEEITNDPIDHAPVAEEAAMSATGMLVVTLADTDATTEPGVVGDAALEFATATEQPDDAAVTEPEGANDAALESASATELLDDHEKAEVIDPIIFDDAEWHMFTHAIAGFVKPASFAQIFDILREQRKQHNWTRTNEQIRTMVKQAINNGLLERVIRGKRVYYRLKPGNQPKEYEEVSEQ